MDFKLTASETKLIMNELYCAWDMAREDLENTRAKKIAKVRDKIVEQYNNQIDSK